MCVFNIFTEEKDENAFNYQVKAVTVILVHFLLYIMYRKTQIIGHSSI